MCGQPMTASRFKATTLEYAGATQRIHVLRHLRLGRRGCWVCVALLLIGAGYAAGQFLLRPRNRCNSRPGPSAMCEVSLRRLGQALYIFAQHPTGRFAERWEQLSARKLCKPDNLFCKSHPSGAACGYRYVLIRGQRTTDDCSNVLAYDPCLHSGSNQNVVLFLDGHVEHVTPQQLEQALRATRRRLESQTTREGAAQ